MVVSVGFVEVASRDDFQAERFHEIVVYRQEGQYHAVFDADFIGGNGMAHVARAGQIGRERDGQYVGVLQQFFFKGIGAAAQLGVAGREQGVHVGDEQGHVENQIADEPKPTVFQKIHLPQDDDGTGREGDRDHKLQGDERFAEPAVHTASTGVLLRSKQFHGLKPAAEQRGVKPCQRTDAQEDQYELGEQAAVQHKAAVDPVSQQLGKCR